MRVPVSWLRDYVDAPMDPAELEPALVKVGLEVEEITDLRTLVTGPLVVGRVAEITELTGFKKPIRHCLVDVGEPEPRSIVCGATNFAPGDLVAVALPGTVLPGGFTIGSRKTYGHLSDGMICSGRELGVSDDHAGILVLHPASGAAPGSDARPLVGLDDVVVELAITPDIGYCLAVRGVARELGHSLRVPFADPGRVDAPAGSPDAGYPVTVEEGVGCDRFAARVVRGVDPAAETPGWIKRRLTMAGMRPISLAVDITNYVMLDLGQPMHAFDLDRIRGPLVVRWSRPGERLTTLDGVDRALDPEDMAICDDTGVISLAAVMGGATTEVHAGTVDVLFEAAHWDPVTVARTARRHKLPSEAAKRWERGVDHRLALVAIDNAVKLLVEHGGGTPDPEIRDIDRVPSRDPVTIDVALPSRTAGVEYPPDRVAALLTEVGCVVDVSGSRLTATPPTWRPDLTDPADLAEEVIRLDGYDNVPSVLPVAPPGNGLTAAQRRRRTVARALAEAGYVEALNYPFVGEQTLEVLGLPRDLVHLANPISEEEPALRPSLLPPLLATLRRNLGRGHRDVALYEQGAVFHPASPPGASPPRMGVAHRPTDAELAEAQRYVPGQPWHVAAVSSGDAEHAGWWGPGRPATWADAVESARTVLAAAGIPADRVGIRQAEQPPWHPGRCAAVLVDGAVVGHAGELHPTACAALDLPRRTVAMELNLDAVPLPPVAGAPAVSTYPPALIDVAVVVPARTPAAEVQQALTTGAGPLLESVRLFDVYQGAQLAEDRKSLAYKLTFRAPDRTLTVEEAVAARDAAVAEAATRFGATLR